MAIRRDAALATSARAPVAAKFEVPVVSASALERRLQVVEQRSPPGVDVALGFDFFELFPNKAQIAPNPGSLYEVQYDLRLESGGSAPLDGIVPTIGFNATSETSNTVFGTRGVPGGGHDLAQSPTTTRDTFSIFLQVDNASLADPVIIPDANTINSNLQLTNRPDLGLVGAGGDDPLLIEDIRIIEYSAPEIIPARRIEGVK